MLSDLLRALAEPRPRSLPEIARSLGTSQERLGLALEQCERLGYLDRMDEACETSSCGACPVACGMTPRARRDLALSTAPRWWRLTDRGRRAAGMPGPAPVPLGASAAAAPTA